MPRVQDIQDITGYFTEAEAKSDSDVVMFSDAVSALLDEMTQPRTRWPVRNRSERTPIGSQKRAIIHERDGVCWYCQSWTLFEVDHIIPRSTFPANQLHIADRSDNLVSACHDCNESKSNYEQSSRKRPGVTVACWECLNPGGDEYLHEPEYLEPRPELPYLAYCGRHGNIGHVPAIEGWIL